MYWIFFKFVQIYNYYLIMLNIFCTGLLCRRISARLPANGIGHSPVRRDQARQSSSHYCFYQGTSNAIIYSVTGVVARGKRSKFWAVGRLSKKSFRRPKFSTLYDNFRVWPQISLEGIQLSTSGKKRYQVLLIARWMKKKFCELWSTNTRDYAANVYPL